MRISDWSSDVCSSDLPVIIGFELRPVFACGEAFRRLSRTAGHGQSFALPVYTVTSAESPAISDLMGFPSIAIRTGTRCVTLTQFPVAFWAGSTENSAPEIGRAHVCTPVTNAQLVCRLLLEKKNK